MYKKKTCAAFILVLMMCVLAGHAFAQGQEPKFNSNPEDIRKIANLLEEFRQDISHKDGAALMKLMLYPDVLFHSIDSQEAVDNARKLNPQFDGIGPSALPGFVTLLATSKDKLEENFQNVEIRQDGDLGLVTFNYDFVINDKIIIQASNTGRYAKSMGNGKSYRLPGRNTVVADLRLGTLAANMVASPTCVHYSFERQLVYV